MEESTPTMGGQNQRRNAKWSVGSDQSNYNGTCCPFLSTSPGGRSNHEGYLSCEMELTIAFT